MKPFKFFASKQNWQYWHEKPFKLRQNIPTINQFLFKIKRFSSKLDKLDNFTKSPMRELGSIFSLTQAKKTF